MLGESRDEKVMRCSPPPPLLPTRVRYDALIRHGAARRGYAWVVEARLPYQGEKRASNSERAVCLNVQAVRVDDTNISTAFGTLAKVDLDV